MDKETNGHMDKNGPKYSIWFLMVFNGPNGPKWFTKIDHNFNMMAFITRFNLVLVWSELVQILTKKFSKWV